MNDIAEQLKTYKPGFLPYDIFLETCRLTVTAIVDIIPLMREDGITKVLLTKREENDKFWPNKYHAPGCVLLATDKESSFDDAFDRILKKELGLKNIKSKPQLYKHYFRQTERGREFVMAHWIELKIKPAIGELFTLDKLPQNIIESQIEEIQEAVKSFENAI